MNTLQYNSYFQSLSKCEILYYGLVVIIKTELAAFLYVCCKNAEAYNKLTKYQANIYIKTLFDA